jgi:hypothetical protein
VQLIPVGFGLEIGEEPQDGSRTIVESNPHLLFELFSLVPSLVFHNFAPIILCMKREPKVIITIPRFSHKIVVIRKERT